MAIWLTSNGSKRDRISAEIECGSAYEFVLNHVLEVADGTELVRASKTEVSDA
jgi:hypothetical protein